MEATRKNKQCSECPKLNWCTLDKEVCPYKEEKQEYLVPLKFAIEDFYCIGCLEGCGTQSTNPNYDGCPGFMEFTCDEEEK